MRKTLVYFHYVTDSHLTNLHFKVLKYYANVFDEVKFCISIDDINDTSKIKDIQLRVLDIFSQKPIKITFYVYKNDIRFCEALFFYNELSSKLNEYDLVYYAHGKGTQTGKDEQSIIHWFLSMYYYTLNDIQLIENEIGDNGKSMTFSNYLLYNTKDNFQTESVFSTCYCGTYIWFNGKKIHNYITRNCINIPLPVDRYYSENFIGNITDEGYSTNNTILTDNDMCFQLYHDCYGVLKNIRKNNKGYIKFYKKILNNG
jgi:hypothetical protein